MREIKFRVWNTNGKCYHYWGELIEKGKIHLLNAKSHRYIVEQFTGYIDDESIDIYEGDIVAANDDHHKLVEVGVVTFCGCRGWIVENDRECCPLGEFNAVAIGNIHENEELLK